MLIKTFLAPVIFLFRQFRALLTNSRTHNTAFARKSRYYHNGQQQQQQQQQTGESLPPIYGGWNVAAAAAVATTALAVTLCDAEVAPQQQNTEQTVRRFVTRSGMKDPMSSYQQQADKRTEEDRVGVLRDPSYQENAILKRMMSKKKNNSSDAEEQEQEAQPMATSASEDAKKPEVTVKGFPTEMTPSEARLEESARKAKQHSGGIKVFSGNGNMSLALEITRHLGISLGKATVGRFADGEVNVVIKENVRGKDVYIVQPTCPPVNENLMELLLMVSTLRRASARRITVVIPYYGYARQDRKMQVRAYVLSTMDIRMHGKKSHNKCFVSLDRPVSPSRLRMSLV